MHPSHPYIAQEVRRGSVTENNRVREKLFAQGKDIDRALCKAKQAYQESKTADLRLQLAMAVGADEAYVKVRRSLAPYNYR